MHVEAAYCTVELHLLATVLYSIPNYFHISLLFTNKPTYLDPVVDRSVS